MNFFSKWIFTSLLVENTSNETKNHQLNWHSETIGKETKMLYTPKCRKKKIFRARASNSKNKIRTIFFCLFLFVCSEIALRFILVNVKIRKPYDTLAVRTYVGMCMIQQRRQWARRWVAFVWLTKVYTTKKNLIAKKNIYRRLFRLWTHQHLRSTICVFEFIFYFAQKHVLPTFKLRSSTAKNWENTKWKCSFYSCDTQ